MNRKKAYEDSKYTLQTGALDTLANCLEQLDLTTLLDNIVPSIAMNLLTTALPMILPPKTVVECCSA